MGVTDVFSTGRQAAFDKDKKSELLTSAIFKIENEAGTAIFSELSGINSEVEQQEYMEAGEKGPEFGRFMGKAKPPTVTLKRAMSSGADTTWIWSWHQQARAGNPLAYQTTTFMLYGAGDDPGGAAKMTYMLINAFPTKVEINGMKAGATEVVIQTVTLQCDEIIGV
jgi:phage tail-like protein